MKDNVDYSLYLVTDRKILKDRDLNKSVTEAIEGGVRLVQLREKDIDTRDFYNVAKELKAITDSKNVPLIINDRLDIALAIDTAGVHLGQKDMPLLKAREILGNEKIIGISVATLEEAIIAEKNGADYLGVGAMFATNSKLDTRSVTLDTLKNIKKSVKIPVVAIGGINETNIEKLKETNIDGVAIISAILGKRDIIKASKELMDILKHKLFSKQ
ncbi:thiamine-phosphate diphosphorylase [Clostridium cavendishii DSM 21758]|uniref:Thiamine-phosphate synthase n=1 Tax=Clostridium cavendishii DSM 21758 TaxID=1121302 RepID=A0A1M6EFA2_9CLOT|nr:thiamine phosphate synthase [Clostridium cavendishii]SHI84059.1 thiamine-phosphate diphosphorylase [Clostridium cavendishii DSM 21758]